MSLTTTVSQAGLWVAAPTRRRRPTRAAFLCLLMSLVVGGQASAQGLYRDPEHRFQVAFPVVPVVDVDSDVYQARAFYGEAAYVVVVTTFQNRQIPRRVLEPSFMSGGLTNGSTLISQRTVYLHGVKGRERTTLQGGFQWATERFFPRGRRLFHIMVLNTFGPEPPDDAEAFLNSFEIGAH